MRSTSDGQDLRLFYLARQVKLKKLCSLSKVGFANDIVTVENASRLMT